MRGLPSACHRGFSVCTPGCPSSPEFNINDPSNRNAARVSETAGDVAKQTQDVKGVEPGFGRLVMVGHVG